MMQDAIRKFREQFAYEPSVENAEKLGKYDASILIGMGGSHLSADILKEIDSTLDLTIHMNYGLPKVSEEKLRRSLIIASSYSGNTEEVLEAYDEAKEKGLPLAVIAVGGALIERAKEDAIPYIQLSNTGIQPRSALGFSIRALMKILGREDMLQESSKLSSTLDPDSFEGAGKALGERIYNKVPVIYASASHSALAYNWKIKLNETGKIPAFCNVFPELNHNEMTGFDVKDASKSLSQNFYFIFLRDRNDHKKVLQRMTVLKQLYMDRGLPVEEVEIGGNTVYEQIFSSLLLADWTAVSIAEQYGLESEQVPMVEEFKKLISE
ncbi:MAG: SIS domain-containing protein [Candidatus Magasanikbacteria bacterium]